MQVTGRVLLIDPDAAFEDRLRPACAARGWALSRARAALEGVQALHLAPDVVAVRDRLPDMAGYEFCRRIRGNPQHFGLPLVFLAGQWPPITFLYKLGVELHVDRIVPGDDVETLCGHIGELCDPAAPPDFETATAREEYTHFLFRKLRRIETQLGILRGNPIDTGALQDLVLDVRTIRDTASANGFPGTAGQAALWADDLNGVLICWTGDHPEPIGLEQRMLFQDRMAGIFDRFQRERGRPFPAPAAVRPQRIDADPPPAVPGVARDVLIVEDDPAVLKMVAYALGNRGLSCETLQDGEAARKRLIQDDAAPRVVLLNINLPGIDGLSILEEMNNRQAIGDRKIIILSSQSREDFMVRAFDSGAFDYITKPFSIPVLVRRVQRAML